jgi:hypothetical protein
VDGRPYAPLQLAVKRTATYEEKAQAVREVLAYRLGVPLDMVPGIDSQDIRDLVRIIDERRSGRDQG